MVNSGFEKKAICIISHKPNSVWFDFLSEFKDYDKYVVIDDNSEDYQREFEQTYPSVNVIQLVEKKCEDYGYININSYLTNKIVTGWEKALFYFSNINKTYDQIWFFEDDIFFFNEETIKNIDRKFPDADLLTAPFKANTGSSKKWWWWSRIKIEYDPPYYNAMVCAARISKNLLLNIDKYAKKHKTLFFLEALFSTIALKHNLSYKTPDEMTHIYFRHNWKPYKLNRKNIFHPIKDFSSHIKIRTTLTKTKYLNNVTFYITDLSLKLYTYIKESLRNLKPS